MTAYVLLNVRIEMDWTRRLTKHGATTLITLMLALPCGAQSTQVTYRESDEIFPNPERGFYAHQSTQAEGLPLSVSEMTDLREQASVTLILRLYYLKPFRDKPLSPEQLDLIAQDFEIMRTAGVKAILRFAYSSDPNEADAPLETINTHLDQLEPLLRANTDVIAAVEAGFIGAWGEWYYSSNNLNTTKGRRAVLEKILDVLPTDRMVQVRTPNYKRAIHDRSEPLSREGAYSRTDYARTGHHNDCFLASPTDYGTYQNIAADKSYLKADTRYTVMGGETCNPNPPRSECETALEELSGFHWSYLNRDYNGSVLKSWHDGGCMDEVKRRLGYRFGLLDSEITGAVRPGGRLSVMFRVANRGFATPYNPRGLELILRHRVTGRRHVASLPSDPRFWTAGDTTVVEAAIGVPDDMPEGAYDVLLFLPAPETTIRERPAYAVRLANEGVWEDATGYNDLLADVRVHAGASGDAYSGSTWLRAYEE